MRTSKANCNHISATRTWKAITPLLTATLLVASAPAYGFLARPVLFAALGGETKAPAGWRNFCATNADDCKPNAEVPSEIVLTPELLQKLYAINSFANDRVKWISDADLYKKTEYWAYPLDRGDCEDVVLLKRRLLTEARWPPSALLVTVVEDPSEHNTLHAVLTVRTDRGEFILDNRTPEVLFWYETSYRYLMRQSSTDPNVWLSFLDKQPKLGPAATVR